MKIVFDGFFNEGGLNQFSNMAEIMLTHKLERWMEANMPSAVYKHSHVEKGVQLTFETPAHYTEFALRWSGRKYKIIN